MSQASSQRNKPGMNRQTSGLIYAGLGSAAASVLSVCVKLGNQEYGLSPYLVVLARSIMLLIFAAIATYYFPAKPIPGLGDGLTPSRRSIRKMLALFFVGFFSWATTVTTALSVVYLSMANAAIFWALAPVLGAVLSPLIGETISKATIRALPLAIFGVLLVSRPPILFGGTGSFSAVGIFFGIAQATSNAATKLMIRVCSGESVRRILLAIGVVSTIATLTQGYLDPALMPAPVSKASWSLLLIACCGGICFQWLSAESLKRTKAAPVLAMMYSSTVWGLLWDYTVFGHLPAGIEMLGAGCIFAGSYMLIFENANAGEGGGGGGLIGKGRGGQPAKIISITPDSDVIIRPKLMV